MVLTYSVAFEFAAAFTTHKGVSSMNHATREVNRMKKLNDALGSTKYSNFILYDNSYKKIKDYPNDKQLSEHPPGSPGQ